MQTGVHCTLKHFPGLGRVVEDTHRARRRPDRAGRNARATDWVPFRALMHGDGVFTMLGHARLIAIDRDTPASFSRPVVAGLLRANGSTTAS